MACPTISSQEELTALARRRPAKESSQRTLESSRNLQIDAASPAGAIVNYTVTATDNSGVTPTVSCIPLSGGTFAIGTTTVNCMATDAAGNSTGGRFTVKVNGPAAQTANLIVLVRSFTLPPVIGNSLTGLLQIALNGFNSGTPPAVVNLPPT